MSFTPGVQEILRFDAAGKLVHVNPQLLQAIVDALRDEQGLTVWQRLDACDREILQLTAQFAELQNEMSLLASVQKICIALDKRASVLESQYAQLLARLASSSTAEPSAVNGVVAGSIPASPAISAVPFGSKDALVAQIEQMFNCQDGDYRSYHSVWSADGYVKHPYTTLGIITPATIPDAPERLRQAMYTSFLKLKQTCKSERPILYWRYGSIERIQEDTEKADHRNVPADIRRPERYKIMTRIAIPEADFSVIGGMTISDGDPYPALTG